MFQSLPLNSNFLLCLKLFRKISNYLTKEKHCKRLSLFTFTCLRFLFLLLRFFSLFVMFINHSKTDIFSGTIGLGKEVNSMLITTKSSQDRVFPPFIYFSSSHCFIALSSNIYNTKLASGYSFTVI